MHPAHRPQQRTNLCIDWLQQGARLTSVQVSRRVCATPPTTDRFASGNAVEKLPSCMARIVARYWARRISLERSGEAWFSLMVPPEENDATYNLRQPVVSGQATCNTPSTSFNCRSILLANSRSWVTTMKLVLNFSLSRCIRSNSAWALLRSRLPVGSSASTQAGSGYQRTSDARAGVRLRRARRGDAAALRQPHLFQHRRRAVQRPRASCRVSAAALRRFPAR